MKSPRQEEIPALTGLRFFAAICIVFNHLLLGIAPARQFPLAAGPLGNCGILGMNLFFVLSGFIIHYNYRLSLERFSLGGLYGFLTARVARLFPLLAVFLAFEFLTEEYIWQADPATFQSRLHALPAFLTFCQTWVYHRLNDSLSLAYAFQNASITWSISTEFLMYLFYPGLLLALLRPAEGQLVRWGKLIVIGGMGAWGIRYFHNHQPDVDAWAVQHLGPQAGLAYNPTHSFAVWWLFLSPYLRFAEFCLGALCAHVFLGRTERPVGLWERRLLPLVMGVALGSIFLSFLPGPYRWEMERAYHTWIGYLPAIAVLIYGSARMQDSWFPRALSWTPFIWAGEASYSIYLIHIVFYNRFHVEAAGGGQAILRALVTIGTVILVARVLYERVENPARRTLRRFFGRWSPGSGVKAS